MVRVFERLSTNQPPDCAGIVATPSSLKRTPDQMKLIALSGATDPDGDTPSYRIDGVTQDERVTAGRRRHSPRRRVHAGWATTNEVFLRAEANPQSNGRVYRIAYTVSDGEGGSCSGTAGKARIRPPSLRAKRTRPRSTTATSRALIPLTNRPCREGRELRRPVTAAVATRPRGHRHLGRRPSCRAGSAAGRAGRAPSDDRSTSNSRTPAPSMAARLPALDFRAGEFGPGDGADDVDRLCPGCVEWEWKGHPGPRPWRRESC